MFNHTLNLLFKYNIDLSYLYEQTYCTYFVMLCLYACRVVLSSTLQKGYETSFIRNPVLQ